MKLTTVIDLLQKDLDDPGSVDIMDLNKAQAIAIEAVNRCQEFRKYTTPGVYMPLPGETE